MALGSFSAGLSGLSAHSTYLSVIGNNLANLNTIGFKASAVRFADLVSQRTSGTSTNPATPAPASSPSTATAPW
jgi:flagellar hook protein FlgE